MDRRSKQNTFRCSRTRIHFFGYVLHESIIGRKLGYAREVVTYLILRFYLLRHEVVRYRLPGVFSSSTKYPGNPGVSGSSAADRRVPRPCRPRSGACVSAPTTAPQHPKPKALSSFGPPTTKASRSLIPLKFTAHIQAKSLSCRRSPRTDSRQGRYRHKIWLRQREGRQRS